MDNDIPSQHMLNNDDTSMNDVESQQSSGEMMTVDVSEDGLPGHSTPEQSTPLSTSVNIPPIANTPLPLTPPTSLNFGQSLPVSFLSPRQQQPGALYSHIPKKRRGRPKPPDSPSSKWQSQRHLFSPQAGTTTLGAKILETFKCSIAATDNAINELSKYKDYELENFTFLQEIIPNLFLGSVRALDAGALDEAGITRVLTVMSSNPHENVPPFANQTGRSREYIMMKDSVQFQSHPWYQTTSAIIDSALHTGQRILIHCRMGISRSATVVAAYLIYRHGLSPAQAIEWMKLQRPIVNPNLGFQEQLQDYYSVLQMDHPSSVPHSFGWSHLSMCSAFTIDPDQEVRKGLKRQRVESVREAWKAKQVEWVKCVTVGWQEDIERILQRHISHISLAL